MKSIVIVIFKLVLIGHGHYCIVSGWPWTLLHSIWDSMKILKQLAAKNISDIFQHEALVGLMEIYDVDVFKVRLFVHIIFRSKAIKTGLQRIYA